MRVVDQDRERLTFVHPFETSGYTVDGLDPLLDRRLGDSERPRSGGRGERVLDVEAPGELQFHVAQRVIRPEGDRSGKPRREPLAVLVADVHYCTVGLREQTPLRFEVLVHCAVEVEMVLGQVGEDEHGETSSLEPSLRRRHRGRLHHAGAIPLPEHLAEEALQVDRLRGVETDLAHVRADPTFDVGEEPG